MRQFWSDLDVPARYLRLNTKAEERFVFLDGPITANNPMGVHHAWGRTLKDVYLRYQTALGKQCRFQNGFDCQGLWVEVNVEKELQLNSKREIYDYGLEPFKDQCVRRVEHYGSLIGEQSRQLGQWMNWDDSYWTHSDSNIEHIWFFLRECHTRGWLYKGTKVMPWCPRCGTSLSQHEQSDSYQDLPHPSVVVAFQVSEPSKSLKQLTGQHKLAPSTVRLGVWTTTPWTLPANVAVATHPELDYVLLQSKNDQQCLVVGKSAFDRVSWMQESYELVTTLTGQDLVGTLLEGPCQSFVPAQSTVTVSVVPWDMVSDEEGTGLVHLAPGCGAEDNEVGKKYDLPTLAPLDENGFFVKGFGFDGFFFSEVSGQVREKLNTLGKLLHDDVMVHRYPVCWRCGEELVYRLVDEWFLSTDEVRPLLLRAMEEVTFQPSSIKARMKNWLENMGDWCISRKRFWGLPLPFFECERCGTLQVFGQVEEFWRAAGFSSEEEFRTKVPDLHRPYLDDLTVPCPTCGEPVNRTTDVGDCWLDAGVVPFSTLGYLDDHGTDSFWSQWFPADFVVEMREQVRLWFYSLLFMSVTLTGQAPYKRVQAYEKVLDEHGRAMHRSHGNTVWWQEAADRLGTDPNRWFYAGWDVSKPLLYGFNNVRNGLRSFNVFWSCCRFLHQNLRLSPSLWDQLSQPTQELGVHHPLDAWLVAHLVKLSADVRQSYDQFSVQEVVTKLGQFWDEVSRWWLRNSRKRFWVLDQRRDGQTADATPYHLLWEAVRLTLHWLAPVVPHVTEYLYNVLVRPLSSNVTESVHLAPFPSFEPPQVDHTLSTAVGLADDLQEVVELGRQLRQSLKVKVRYTLPQAWVKGMFKASEKLKVWQEVLEGELNVDRVSFAEPEDSSLGHSSNDRWQVWLDTNVSQDRRLEWVRSDVLRTVQFLRKKSALQTSALAKVALESPDPGFARDVLSPPFVDSLRQEAFVEQVDSGGDTTNGWVRAKVKGVSPSLYVHVGP